MRTPLDDFIPVVGPFATPYVPLRPFPYGSLALFLVFRARIYRSAALSMTTAFPVSNLFYFFLLRFAASTRLKSA